MSAQIIAFPPIHRGPPGESDLERYRRGTRATFPLWSDVQVESRAKRMVALQVAARAEIAKLEPRG